MAGDTHVDAWRLRLKAVGLRLQHAERLPASDYVALKAEHREIERLIQSLQR